MITRILLVCLVTGIAARAHAQVTAYAFVPNANDNTVTAIDTATLSVLGAPIPVGLMPIGAALTPDARLVLVVNAGSNTVTAIDVATRTATGPAIP